MNEKQIRMQCMDCFKRSVGSRAADAPARAVLYMLHCGCKLPPTSGPPYYLDATGRRIT